MPIFDRPSGGDVSVKRLGEKADEKISSPNFYFKMIRCREACVVALLCCSIAFPLYIVGVSFSPLVLGSERADREVIVKHCTDG